jgi:hypothetical protein
MPTLSQKEITLRSAVAGILYSQAVSNPTPTDDRNLRYIIGSRWINLLTHEEFVCLGNEPTAAVWVSTTSGGSGSIHTSTSAPTSADDVTEGYSIGTIWVVTTTNTVYICASTAEDAAVWVAAGGSGGAIHIDTVAPTASDDTTEGFVLGHLWVNTVSGVAYIAVNVTTASAVWTSITGGGGSAIHTATTDPTATDDSSDGFIVGTIWVNTATDRVFIATDVTVASAVWVSPSDAAYVSAATDPYLEGTTVQSQLTSISGMLRGVSGYIRGVVGVGYTTLTLTSVRSIDGYYVT